MEQDIIVDIKESQYGYFGGPGKMLLPSRATVESMIRRVPPSMVITTDLLRKKMAKAFDVRGTCPVTTRKMLQTISNDPECDAAYWRVINQNGNLIAQNPGGIEAQDERLTQEGLSIEHKGNTARVRDFKARIVDLG